ncbi:hypothetical protein [Tropicimonas sp. S265A]|uniref:hypothetical protein n=1 Tax=Tropicimonas sp. S265A TaxID=3415134 RepID=UPI003C7B81B9
MASDEEYCDGYPSDQEPSFRSHTDITPDELTSALHSLVLLRSDMYLGLQVTNLTAVDQFIMNLEHNTLQEFIRTDKTPSTTMFLNAQSQMWIFAAYELLRTWRARAKDAVKLASNGGLELKAASLEEDQGYLHAGRAMRARQLREIAADPSIVETINTDLRRAHIPFSRLEHLRVSFAKHEVRGRNNSIAYAPGYGRISMMNGSLQYQLENGPVILDTISRRDIADELRALNDQSSVPTDEDLESFDEFMRASMSKEELQAMRADEGGF